MALSNFILDIGKEIEEKSGLYLNFAKGSTKPMEEWISEDQISRMKSITLRTAKQSQNEEVIKLLKFNPSLKLKERGRIHCRVPDCEVTKRALPTGSSEKKKQDLFLCDEHHKVLKNLVLERCAKENVIVNIANYTPEDFEGYTNLIGLLEKAFRHIMKKSSRNSTDSVLAEVFLNSRNFLFLTNALLNPDEANVLAVLAPYLKMFEQILHLMKDPSVLQNLLTALREVVNIVLFFFGVIYPWMFLGNPGAQVAAGVGFVIGFVGGVLYGFPATGIFATSVVGLIAGKLIGGGSYDWNRERPGIEMEQEMIMKYQTYIVKNFGKPVASTAPLFRVHADADGNLSLNFEQDE